MNRKYNPAWEADHKWLPLKHSAMFCKLCNCSISSFKKHNLVMHEKTAKHVKNEKSMKSSTSLVQLFHNNNKKKKEFTTPKLRH